MKDQNRYRVQGARYKENEKVSRWESEKVSRRVGALLEAPVQKARKNKFLPTFPR
jgi:hypothetical protein